MRGMGTDTMMTGMGTDTIIADTIIADPYYGFMPEVLASSLQAGIKTDNAMMSAGMELTLAIPPYRLTTYAKWAGY